MEENVIKNLGLKVRSLRKTAKITQEELASLCDVSWRTISNLERGCVIPDLLMVCRIARHFRVGVDELLDIGEKNPKPYSRIFAEDQLVKRIKTADDKVLSFIVDQLDVIQKHLKE